ncbi:MULTISPECIES: putative toxin-antitoxin system toxin component, PIN family [unclassified Meiothermus]|uniref:PIN domain-containing protein n=1 Tax=unclassified Meiothermus TaxID=370471 RepID=UPI000D7C25DC|nr:MULTISPECIES: PIN domain-containing protein [unclassified Meiothermus]PZA07275.1 hypothetical protein DNA98_08705 [Meiothermus sp. Pnk-1]RYM38009.1 PIN domain-containing protein [Meiothermus sp. PNK-Is4]
MRLVLDTNVLVAGTLTQGPAAKVLDLWIEGRFDLLTSEAQLAELKRILQTKFKAHISPVRRAQLLGAAAQSRDPDPAQTSPPALARPRR